MVLEGVKQRVPYRNHLKRSTESQFLRTRSCPVWQMDRTGPLTPSQGLISGTSLPFLLLRLEHCHSSLSWTWELSEPPLDRTYVMILDAS